MTDRLRVLGLISGATGIIALFIPFTAGISPLDGVVSGLEVESDGLFIFSISAPSLLAIPIAAWQLRRIWFPDPEKLETLLACLFSTVSMLPVLMASSRAIAEMELRADLLGVCAVVVYWLAVIANIGLFVRNRIRGRPPGTTVEVFLLLGYVPNALFALIVFSYWGIVFGPHWMWDTGAYVVSATCIMYTAQAFWLLRRNGAVIG